MKTTSAIRRVVGTFALVILLPACLLGRPHNINLELTSVTLKNGRTYAKCVLRSYDPENGRVVLVEGRNMTSVQLELLPQELAEKVVALTPPEAKDAARQAKEREIERRRSNESASAAKRAETEKRRQAERDQATRQAEAHRAAAKEAQVKSEAKWAAYARAKRYFSYEYKPGSGYVIITSRGIELSEPETVAGWDNRLRVRGTVGLEFYDSYGNSFNTTTREFEVTVEITSSGSVKVTDLTLK